jgi:hypothetical protein
MRLAPHLTVALIAALLCVSSLASAAKQSQSARVQVICITALRHGGHSQGRYRRRPADCRFHKRGTAVVYRDTAQMRNIEWLSWGGREAVGVGNFYANTSGPVRGRLRLSHPVNKCGHRVFTLVRFTFKDIETARPGLFIDRRAPGLPCQ